VRAFVLVTRLPISEFSMKLRLFLFALILLSPAAVARAQTQPTSPPAQPPHQHPPDPKASAEQPPADMPAAMEMSSPLGVSMAREGSGTAWLPETTPIFALHRFAGPWRLMLHENLFVQYINESGARGDDQFGSSNWMMGMAHRDVAGGPLTLRAMLSVEPLTVGECGYPTLLATGESCDGEPLHDRQHPHDTIMELAVQYQRAINSSFAYQVYGGLAGEPALGPVAFPHRVSALPNPVAPISHHWLDSTHISFGVLTAGLYQRSWKAEASLFNGREPDEARYDIDFGALDSVAGRFWWLPTDRWALQISAGHLNEAEPDAIDGARRDVDRMTASATYHHASDAQRFWATTIAWGRNLEDGVATNALLAESSLALRDRDTMFGRAEISQKSAHDLVLPQHDDEGIFTVGKLQAGYVRYFRPWASFAPGVGASVSFSIVPDRLSSLYGGRTTAGFALFFNLRPSEMIGGAGHQHP
jgi:hypothetical protein